MTTPVAGTTHEFCLDDGTTKLGFRAAYNRDLDDQLMGLRREPLARMSASMRTGEQRYSDLEPPYTTIAQNDFKGGRAQEDFVEDNTKFYDSKNLCTLIERQAILGPKVNAISFGTAYPEFADTNGGTSSLITIERRHSPIPSVTGGATSFITDAAVTVTTLQLYLQGYGTSASMLMGVYICADTADAPGSVIGSSSFDCNTLSASFAWKNVAISASLSAATKYWIVLIPGDYTVLDGNKQVLWFASLFGAAQTYHSAKWDSTAYTAPDPYDKTRAYFKINNGTGVINQPIGGFVEYYGARYAYTTPKSGTAKLLLNGDRGAADSNSADKTKLNDATKAWVTNEWAGCVAKIVDGPGLGEWRTIASNTGTVITVSTAWTTTHTTSTAYVILGSNKWQEILAGTFTAPITSICGGRLTTLYIAQGDSVDVQRLRWLVSSGAHSVAAQTDRRARIIANVAGTIYRWYYASNDYRVHWGSDNRAWADNLDDNKIGDDRNTPQDACTNIVAFDGTVLMFTTKRVYAIVNNAAFKATDIAYESEENDYNGRAVATWNNMLYFSVGFGLERMFSKQIDDIGPNRGTGLPTGRQGRVAAISPTVDTLYYGIDADNDTSSVMAYNNFGHHEIARALGIGASINALSYQVIPNGPNRLWYAEGETIRSVKMPHKTSNPYFDTGLVYNAGCELITSWYDLGLSEATKFWHELTLITDNLLANTRYISVYYQTDNDDDDSAWTALPNDFDTSPSQTELIRTDYTLTAKRIRFKLVFTSLVDTTTPRLKAIAIEAVYKMQAKFAYTVPVILMSEMPLMDDTEEAIDINAYITQLDTWSAPSQEPLLLTSSVNWMNNKRVFLDPCPVQPVATDDESGSVKPAKYILTLRLTDA